MNRLFFLLFLSILFIALAMPLPLFADDDGRGEGSGGATLNRHKQVEEGSGSSAIDHQKKSSMEYKDHHDGKSSGYKKEGRNGMGKAHQYDKDAMGHDSDHGSQTSNKANMREGS